jgi:hypothetical protein
MLVTLVICLTQPKLSSILPSMLSIDHTVERPSYLSVAGAFLCAEAWQSGLSQRAYPSPDLWASKPLAGSRQFESDRFHHLNSGAVAVDAVTTPDHRPGDEPAATTVLSNIRFDGRIFQSRQSSPLHPKDELREQPFPRKAD